MQRLICAFVLFLAAISGSESLTAQEKQDQIWKFLIADTTPGTWPDFWEQLELFLEDLQVTGNRKADDFPAGRAKVIHSVGAVAKFKFNWAENPYTGLFQGADYGFIRASSAAQPGESGGVKTFLPGISIKVFRDGDVESGNFFAMYQLDGQNDFNFFLNPFCNHVADRPDLPLAQKLLGYKFKTVSDYPGLVGLSDFARYNQSGGQISNPQFPFALVFQPNPVLTQKFLNTQNYDIPNLFPASFNGSEILYKVYGVDSPSATSVVFLGTVQLTSKWTATAYGDAKLFFRHTFIEEDWKVKPDWKTTFTSTNRYQQEGVNIYTAWLPPF